MRPTVRLGRVAGIQIGINLGVFVVIALIGLGLAMGRFPAQYPGRPLVAYVVAGVAAALLFIASVLVHEIAHAVVARRNGIEVESITLWLFGGVASLRGEPRTPGADFAIAVVGPLSSLVLGIGFGGLAWALYVAGVDGLPVAVTGYLAGANIVLAVFNLVPAAPLDGGRVLRAAWWRITGDRVRAIVAAARAGRIFGLLLIALGIVQVLMGSFGGLWLALVGWFLVHAATAEEASAAVGQRLNGLRVGDVMTPNPVGVPPDATVDAFIGEVAMRRPFSTYPLVDPVGRLLGLVTLNRIRQVPPARRATTRLAEIACPPSDVPLARPDEPLVDLLPRLVGCTDGRAVVVDDEGRVVGVVSPSDISRAAAMAELRGMDPYPSRGADLNVTVPARDAGPPPGPVAASGRNRFPNP